MADWTAKRFWKVAEAIEVEGGWSVALDGRSVRTPLKSPVTVPTRALAQALATEWDAQQEAIDPLTMPITRAVNATLDKVIPQFAEVADMLAEYGGSDLLCYRADHPEGLVSRQAATWDPLLQWFATAYQAKLVHTSGIMAVSQSEQALAAMREAVHQQSAWEMTAFHEFVTLSGSLVIAFAVMDGHSDLETLWKVSRIDEDWQAEQWGDDDEALALAQSKRAAFLQAAEFLRLVRG